MKYSIGPIVVVFIFLIAFSACKKDKQPAPVPTTAFTLQLMAKYGNQSFALNTPNTDAQGRYIKMTTLRFYLSHINLIKSNGDSVSLSSVALLDFGADTAVTVTANNIQGNFTGISFACGLDSLTDDTTNPNNYIPPNPLAGVYGMPWLMLKYQFEILEGFWDTTYNGSYPNPLVYHIGTNAAYRYTRLSQNFSVTGNYNMVLYLDVAQIFNNTQTGETINIVTEYTTMSSSNDNPAVLPAFADNFSHAFTFSGP